MRDRRSTVIKAAVMYDGAADVQEFRPDLPVRFVRAGLDRPPVNQALTQSLDEAVAAGHVTAGRSRDAVPQAYRPNLMDDPVFASIRNRGDFKALFAPR